MRNWLIGILVILLASAAYYYIKVYDPFAEEAPPPPTIVAVEQPKPEPVLPEPTEEYIDIVPEPELEEEVIILPTLAESDSVVLDSLFSLTGDNSALRFLVSDNLIPRFVASVDALTSRQVPSPIMMVRGLEGEFLTTANEQPEYVIRNDEGDPIPQYFLNPANYKRYSSQVEFFEAHDSTELVALYQYYAPLSQQAYSELGYPEGNFDSRLIEVIESLLATPEVTEPLLLIKPEAFYLFADPDLEALSAGQKVLLRMGPINAQRVKEKLREIRGALAK
jgi:hypothetical protein